MAPLAKTTPAQLKALVAEHGTPLVVVNHDILRQTYAQFTKHLPRVQAYYAVKANPAPEIVRTLFEAGASFDCRIDFGSWGACTSPHTTASLAEGNHTFQVRATDGAANLDATPAVEPFTVVASSGSAVGWGNDGWGQATDPTGLDVHVTTAV